jgi:peptidyl-prolyl cis-trans isomerase D
MISWIQRYFQHHFKTIFAVLLAITIISFIFTIGASPGIGRGDRRFIERQYFGYNLAMAEDQQRLMGDASLSARLRFGPYANLENDQLQQFAFQRAATLHLAEQWHVPAAAQAEITEAIKTLRMFASPDGQFDAKAYATFRDNLKTNPRGSGLTEADIVRVVGDDVRAEKVTKLLAGPGYVLPGDVKKQLERADTSWKVETATANYAAFKPDIKPTEAELKTYFDQSGGAYDIPPRVVASYVDFPASAYLPGITVTDAEVRAYYDANPQRFPKPPEAKPADGKAAPAKPADANADFAAVRPQVELALKQERARKLATKAASDLAVAIFEAKVQSGPALDTLLASQKLQPKPLATFTREAGPAELGGSPQIADEAFKLGKDHFVSDALSTPTGAVVLFWKDTQPARKPEFAEVHTKAAADYVENERRKRFVELGRTAKAQLESRLKAGDTFEKAVATVSTSTGLKFETKSIAAFTLRTRPQDLDYSVLGSLERLNQGQVSDLAVSADKGIFVYVAEKKLPDLSESNPRFIEMRSQLAAYTSQSAAQAYISELVDRELKRTQPVAE